MQSIGRLVVHESLCPGRNTRQIKTTRARYGVSHLQRSEHGLKGAQKSKRNWRSSAKVNPPLSVAVIFANVAGFGIMGSAGGRHMPKPYDCRNWSLKCLVGCGPFVALQAWLRSAGNKGEKNPNQTSFVWLGGVLPWDTALTNQRAD